MNFVVFNVIFLKKKFKIKIEKGLIYLKKLSPENSTSTIQDNSVFVEYKTKSEIKYLTFHKAKAC